MKRIDATDIAAINEYVQDWAGPDDQVHPVRIDDIVVAEDAREALAEQIAKRAGGKRVLVISDSTPMYRVGVDLKPLVAEALATVCRVEIRELSQEPGQRFHARIDTARQLAEEFAGDLKDVGAVVSVGSGSITDVAKYARHLHHESAGRRIPFISFPTAASVTAYTSALAVLSIDGVKRTLPAAAPDAVVCDLLTLVSAPRIMNQAGFGDVLARSVSYGDWYLAHQLGMDDGFSLVPGKLLEHAEQEMLENAEGVGSGEIDGIRSVVDALLLSGMAMSIARQTAPLSGWEHAISHFLDLIAKSEGRETALHGGQVGIGTLVSARAYESAWGELQLERITEEKTDNHYCEILERVFTEYSASRSMISELWRELEKKVTSWRRAGSQRRDFVARKAAGEFEGFLSKYVRSAEEIKRALVKAKAPCMPQELDVFISQESTLAAIRHAHLVRARFTLGDLLTEAGWLDEARAESLLR